MRLFLAFLYLGLLSACSTDLHDGDPMFRMSDDSGSLRVGLRGSDASGKQYRLRGATFEISGTAMVTMSNLETPGDALATALPTGSYQMYLRPGHSVVEVWADGTEHPITARLSSANPIHVHVMSRTDRQVSLSFQHEAGEIAFGASKKAPQTEPQTRSDMLARAP